MSYFPPALAAFPDFLSNPSGLEPNSYVVEWRVRSHSPVQQFVLRWRRNGDAEWVEEKQVTSRIKNKYEFNSNSEEQ